MKMFAECLINKRELRWHSFIFSLLSGNVTDQNLIPENNHIVIITLSLDKASIFYVLCYKTSLLS